MPDPVNPARPLGLGQQVWSILSRPPQQTPSGAVRGPARDAYAPSGLSNPRFAGDPDLEQVRAGRPLQPGGRSEGVAAVQAALNDMGFIVPGGATGHYGPRTVQAIKNFQTMAGLTPDGVLGPQTMRALDRFAPPPGRTSWDRGVDPGPIPSPRIEGGKLARVVVSISQHRAFFFDRSGNLTRIVGVRTGRADHEDGRGAATTPGVRMVTGKNADPREISSRLWPESGGKAFGTRLIDLTLVDPVSGRRLPGQNGQELHGTYLEDSLGRDFSHGCVGMSNAEIERLYDMLRVGDMVRFDA